MQFIIEKIHSIESACYKKQEEIIKTQTELKHALRRIKQLEEENNKLKKDCKQLEEEKAGLITKQEE